MKKLFCLLFVSMLGVHLFAQAPQRLSYQAIIRNASNVLVTNAPIKMRLSILKDSINASPIYTELHSTTTNASGVAFVQVGGGTSPSSSFSAINWGQGAYFLRSETDPANGINYSIVGTTQLLSVPYALFSNRTARADSAARATIADSARKAGSATTADNGLPTSTIHGALQLYRCNGKIQYTPCLPLITTNAASSIASTSATSGGNITNDGGSPVTSRGIVWDTIANPSIPLATMTFNGTGTGSFTSNLTNLIPNKTYYVRAYATNGAGTTYGTQVSFQTPLPNASLTTLNCAGATNNGTLTAGVPAASGITSIVPYTGGNGGIYTSLVAASTNVTGLAANLTAGTLANGAGSLTFTITGTPATSGTANFTLTVGGQTCILARTVVSPPLSNVNCNGINTAIVDVTNPTTGRVWMDRNLGAGRAAFASADTGAYGDLYQWGRRADGHQCRNSITTLTLSSTDQPSNGNFILAPSTPNDWRSPQNSSLWQGVSGINNPCPQGYRIPTEQELNAEVASWNSSSAAGAFSSPLKLPTGGDRDWTNGGLANVGVVGNYWSSTVNTTFARYLLIRSNTTGNAFMSSGVRASGYSVRCIKN
ncbi:MAG: hypothetical protein KGP35_01105 [Bacteroidetes bacterium]|nr:hypothetical protein [Bacteroidota bacterium]